MIRINMFVPKITPLCSCGCGREVKRTKRTDLTHNRVPGNPAQYLKGHCGAQANKKTVQYYVDPESGCWIWLLSVSSGYGNTKGVFGSKKIHKAHRVIYEKHKGPIPEGLVLDHLCENKLCVNPDHLEPVTVGENNRRKRERNRAFSRDEGMGLSAFAKAVRKPVTILRLRGWSERKQEELYAATSLPGAST